MPSLTRHVVLLAACLSPTVSSAQVVADMTSAEIAAAVIVGERNKVPAGDVSYPSWGMIKVTIATFSTPFMRVAAAARQAKREYRAFGPDDITAEMTAPELHVYAWPVAGAEVQAVVITPKGLDKEERLAAATHASRLEPLPATFQNWFGATFEGVGKMAVFPLSVLTKDHEVHIVYNQRVSMSSGPACDDCKGVFKLKDVR
jgi:hypothetical protein